MLPMRESEQIRIRTQLASCAQPDSRFQYDLDCFIPSFQGNELATQRAVDSILFASANLVFVTPDNALRNFRTELIREMKSFLIPTYGLVRGYLLIEPDAAMAKVAELASTLDGIEHFGRSVGLDEIASLGNCDFVAAGTSALSMSGVRFGMGFHYLDAEMVILDTIGFTSPSTQVVTLVHDCQISSEEIETTSGHVRVATAFTPTTTIDLGHSSGLRDPGAPQIPHPLCEVPVFDELRNFRK